MIFVWNGCQMKIAGNQHFHDSIISWKCTVSPPLELKRNFIIVSTCEPGSPIRSVHRCNKSERLSLSKGSGCVKFPRRVPFDAWKRTGWQIFAENNSFWKHSARWQVLFPTKCGNIHLPQGHDPLRVGAMFLCLPGVERGLGVGNVSCEPPSAKQLCGIRCKPRVSMRGSANPYRLVPVEPRPLVHSSNLISCNFITGGGRGAQRGLIWKNIIVYPPQHLP